MSTLTLIGTRLAEVDREFVYQGPSTKCEGCPYRDQCLNLAEGTRYRVSAVRENASVLPCAVHDDGVRAVEVEPAPMIAAVSQRGAYAGNRTTLPGACPHVDCPSHEYCEPVGADLEEDYRIREIIGEPPHEYCHLGRDLTLVELDPTA